MLVEVPLFVMKAAQSVPWEWIHSDHSCEILFR